ncbi:hypothetical protein LguiA_011656 [Lonicera macranthoides]
MGDSETVVAQTSSMMGYTSAGYSSVDCGDVRENSAPESEPSLAGPNGDLANPTAPTITEELPASTGTTDGANEMDHDSNLGAGNVDIAILSLAEEEVRINTACATTENPDSTTNASVDSSQVGGYDSSLNGDAGPVALAFTSENGITSDDVHGSAPMHQLVDASALSAEEERLWSIVRANSLDFNAWTALIEETEKMAEDNIVKIRKVYDAFLAEFPLCYGYWKKYADHEARLGSIDKVVEVYERAVQGVTYSVDIWLHYCVFAISTYGDPDIIRRLFERGLTYVGTDYLSFPLWDKYIEYEYAQQDWSRLAMIYTRILENPNQQLDRYFTSFRELVASRPLSELRSAEEAAATAVTNLEAGGQVIEGDVHPDNVEQPPKPLSAAMTEAEELEKYMNIREEMYRKAKEFDSKIIGFETAIRRPYFHVRPLNVAELENWHNYLDFSEGGDDFNKHLLKRDIELGLKQWAFHLVSIRLSTSNLHLQGGSLLSYLRGLPVPRTEYSYAFLLSPLYFVVKLYERCLIACANYPEYWIRYVLCMEASGSMDLAQNALARATQVFVKRQPEIHLFAARFREHSGDIPGSRAAYQLVHSEISPGLLEAIIKHANMEHRLGNLQDACSIYEQAIAIEKGKEHSQSLPLLFAQFARFLHLVCGKVEKAREVIDEALQNNQLSKPLLEALIHLESIQLLPKRVEYLDSLVDKFISPSSDNSNAASIAEREELSSIFLEFLDLFGDAQSIKKADDRHAKLFVHHKSASESKKRHAEDFLVSDKTKLAKSGVLSSPAPSVMGAYQGAQNQWATGYGVQPQAWPQVAQTQAQQYNPAGYTQQAAYGAYGSYGSSYVQPQISTSAPQTAAATATTYGAYPLTYSTQAYPQQGYVQPAAATSVPVQQPTSVPPQTYYGSYY